MDVFFTLDLIGTAVFAYTGSVAAKKQRFHILGVFYISFLTAVGGGTLRGLLLQTPDLFWMKSSAYLLVVGAIVGLSYLIKINTNRLWFYVLDSQSLAVFVALGFHQTLSQGQPLHIAFAMGLLSGIGGGLIRDAITSQPPQALSDPAYPVMMTAAAIGSIVSVNFGLPAYALACFAVLMVVLVTIGLNYHRTGRLVEYDRTGQNDNHHAAQNLDDDGSQHNIANLKSTYSATDVSNTNRETGTRLRQQIAAPNRKAKSGLMAIGHACGVIVLSGIAGFYYFSESITDATANVPVSAIKLIKTPPVANTSASSTTDHLADEKLQYLATLQSIESLLNSRQIAKAEKLISNARLNSHADARLELLTKKAVNFTTYLATLDQAELALASNDETKLKESITLASTFGYADHRLNTLKMSLENLQERAELESANNNLAEKSFQLHLTSAKYHLGLGNIDLAFAEIETAKSFRLHDPKLDHISEQIKTAKLFDSTPLTDTEYAYATNRFSQLERAIELKNINAITTLTSDSTQRKELFTGLFNRYVKINTRVSSVVIEKNSKTVKATLTLEKMRLSNGNIAYPSDSYGNIELSIQRTRQGWSKISW